MEPDIICPVECQLENYRNSNKTNDNYMVFIIRYKTQSEGQEYVICGQDDIEKKS